MSVVSFIGLTSSNASASEASIGVTDKAKEIALSITGHTDDSMNVCRNALLKWESKYDESLVYVINHMNADSRSDCAKQIQEPRFKSVISQERYALITQYLPKQEIVIGPDPDRSILAEAKSADPNQAKLQTLAMYDGASASAVDDMFKILKDYQSKPETFKHAVLYESVRETVCHKRTDVQTCQVM